jgi:hypothetical protein
MFSFFLYYTYLWNVHIYQTPLCRALLVGLKDSNVNIYTKVNNYLAIYGKKRFSVFTDLEYFLRERP